MAQFILKQENTGMCYSDIGMADPQGVTDKNPFACISCTLQQELTAPLINSMANPRTPLVVPIPLEGLQHHMLPVLDPSTALMKQLQ